MFADAVFHADSLGLVAPQSWRPMQAEDLAPVEALGNRVHATLPESFDVFAERRALFPAGAWVADHRRALAGYALAHPWVSGTPPMLNALLHHLPPQADCLYLHDIVVDPIRRSLGLAGAMIDFIPSLARALRLPAIELVAVLGTANFWRGHGFILIDDPALAPTLAKYGDGSALMRRAL